MSDTKVFPPALAEGLCLGYSIKKPQKDEEAEILYI
jgi:hypothetical protein